MSADILSSLLAANIAASAAILFVLAIRKTARRMIGARLAYWLWAVPVLAGFAALLPARDAGTVPAPAAPIRPIADATVELATAWTAPATAPVQAGLNLPLLLLVIWTAGAACFLGLMLLQQQRALHAMKLAPDETSRRTAKRAASNFGPAVVGVLKPLLVVPADFEQRFSPPEQSLVLAHEHEHLAAGHTRINAALVALTSLNWFNPLVHWAARLARADQELACDAAVLERFPRERGVYAEALLKAHIAPALLPLGCTWPSRSSRFLKERMTMLANKSPGRVRRMAGAGFIVAALLGAGLAAWGQKAAVPLAGAMVEIASDGRIMWNGKLVEGRMGLDEQARNQVASGVPRISLSADPGMPYLDVRPVIESAQKRGMRDIIWLPSGAVFATPTPPPPGAKPPANAPDPVRAFIDFDGAVFWNGKVVDAAMLEQNLRNAAALSVQPEIHIEPHRAATYAQVEQLIAAVRRTGVEKVAILGPGGTPALPEIIAGTVN
jgi:beta-lactamase regulating signal transducer with metallopeptidase domain/biopolymer transport protein ExbD